MIRVDFADGVLDANVLGQRIKHSSGILFPISCLDVRELAAGLEEKKRGFFHEDLSKEQMEKSMTMRVPERQQKCKHFQEVETQVTGDRENTSSETSNQSDGVMIVKHTLRFTPTS